MAQQEKIEKLLKKALEDIITTETGIVTFLKSEYGDDAVRKFYSEYRPKFILELQLGVIRRAIAKMAAKIAKKTLLKMIIDTLLEKGEWYQPPDTVEILQLTKDEAAVRIITCNRRKMFSKIMKKIDKKVEPSYFCQICCMPELKYYFSFIGLIPSIKIDPEGCCVSAVWDPTKIKFEEEAPEDLEAAAQKEVNNF
jgi:hypothetical protein